MGEIETLHDLVDGESHLSRIGVTSVDYSHWQRVSREHDDHVVAHFGWKLFELSLNVSSKRLHNSTAF